MNWKTFDLCGVICFRELLEKYRQCKTSAEVIAVQDSWLEAERRVVKSDSIDYPPSCSSSSDGESKREDDVDESENKPLSGIKSPAVRFLALYPYTKISLLH